MKIKEDHPFIERIMTRKKLFGKYPAIPKKITFQAGLYFLKILVYYPWRHLTDPTYSFPKGLFKEFLRRVKKMHWDVDQVIDIFKRHHKNNLYQDKIYVLSHIHEPIIKEKNGRVIIHPGSWRDEYDLTKGKLIPRIKKYVYVLVTEKGNDFKLIDCPIKRNVLNFNEVIKNETKYLNLAAAEESYTFHHSF
jgi:hypothetical protein